MSTCFRWQHIPRVIDFPFGIGKTTALKVLQNQDCSNLEVFDNPSASQTSAFGAKQVQIMNELHYQLFIRRRNKVPSLKSLSPTDQNLTQHLLRAHYQVMLWKAADQAAPPAEHCTNFGWQKVDPPAPQELMKVIACSSLQIHVIIICAAAKQHRSLAQDTANAKLETFAITSTLFMPLTLMMKIMMIKMMLMMMDRNVFKECQQM